MNTEASGAPPRSQMEPSLTDLPPELIGEIVLRMSAADVDTMVCTHPYLRDAACANPVWIKRCLDDFGVRVDRAVAEETGPCSVYAFYQLILRNSGPYLGPLQRSNLPQYSGLFQLVHDGGLGLVCLEWLPPPPKDGVRSPMRLNQFYSVTLARASAQDQHGQPDPKAASAQEQQQHAQKAAAAGGGCVTSPSAWYRVDCKVLDSFNGSPTVTVGEMDGALCVHTPGSVDFTREPDRFRCLWYIFAHRDHGIVHLEELDGNHRMIILEKAMKIYNTRDLYVLERPDLLITPPKGHSMPLPITAGLFKGSYGPHGTELIHLRYHEESGTVFFSGTKVTGDPNVPVGKQTFVGDLSKDSLFMQLEEQASLENILEASDPQFGPQSRYDPSAPVQPFQLPTNCHARLSEVADTEPKYCLSRFRCRCKIARENYSMPQWIMGNMIIFSEDVFGVLFIKLRCMNFFHRVPAAEIAARSLAELAHLEVIEDCGDVR